MENIESVKTTTFFKIKKIKYFSANLFKSNTELNLFGLHIILYQQIDLVIIQPYITMLIVYELHTFI